MSEDFDSFAGMLLYFEERRESYCGRQNGKSTCEVRIQ